jgi:hypothetical protein
VSIFTLIRNDLSVFLTFCRYQNISWFFFLLVFVVATGVSGKHFVDTPKPPATTQQIFSFGATIAGNTIPWSALSSDYTAYFHPRVSRFVKFLWWPASVLKSNLREISWRIFAYSFLGLNIPTVRNGTDCLATPLTTYRSPFNASALPQQYLLLRFLTGMRAMLTVMSVDSLTQCSPLSATLASF